MHMVHIWIQKACKSYNTYKSNSTQRSRNTDITYVQVYQYTKAMDKTHNTYKFHVANNFHRTYKSNSMYSVYIVYDTHTPLSMYKSPDTYTSREYGNAHSYTSTENGNAYS